MKKLTLAALIGAALTLSQGAIAEDGTVTINGKVITTTCQVDANSKNLTVTLPTVSTAALDAANKTTGRTPFSIKLTGCDSNTAQARIYFEPDPANTDLTTGNLLNKPTGSAAQNVQVQILKKDGATKIDLSQDVAGQGADYINVANQAAASLDYYARYVAVNGAAGAGEVKSVVNYTVDYK